MNWALGESSDDDCDNDGTHGWEVDVFFVYFWDAVELRDSWVWGTFVEETIHMFTELVFDGEGEVL